LRSNRTRPITPLPPGANKIPFWLSMISSVTVGCCGVVTRVPARAENHAPVGLTQTCCRLQERVEDFRQIECRLTELAGDIRDGRGDASHRQLLKDIENANVLTGGCVCRSLPDYTVHATKQMIRRNVRQNTEPFSTSCEAKRTAQSRGRRGSKACRHSAPDVDRASPRGKL
jgi:hypothetical protein